LISASTFVAFLSVIGIDLVLSGDNAVVIGTAAAGLPAQQRHKAIALGIALAAVTRMAFAMIAFYLLKIIGLLLAGGVLLLWVAWLMWGQIRAQAKANRLPVAEGRMSGDAAGETSQPRSFRHALMAIVFADVSMSLDNILAVTGAAQGHFLILVFGLALSIALMGLAANIIARLMNRYYGIVYVGVSLVFYVALDMIWRGFDQVAREIGWIA
jgi:YjbE family integral membrane protein